MAWNPSPEIAVLRDAANKLGAPIAVMVCIMPSGDLQTLSYGRTKALCDKAKELAGSLHEATMQHYEDPEPTDDGTAKKKRKGRAA